MVLEDAGVPRMPARLFAFALASDQDAHTAREFADGLEVKPGGRVRRRAVPACRPAWCDASAAVANGRTFT